MVAGKADGAVLLDQVGALVGLGAVADDVAQAPDLVGRGGLDLGQNGLERGQVAVDVGNDREAQAVYRKRRMNLTGARDLLRQSPAARAGLIAVALIVVAEGAVLLLAPSEEGT